MSVFGYITRMPCCLTVYNLSLHRKYLIFVHDCLPLKIENLCSLPRQSKSEDLNSVYWETEFDDNPCHTESAASYPGTNVDI